jgi:hypothetical protein
VFVNVGELGVQFGDALHYRPAHPIALLSVGAA